MATRFRCFILGKKSLALCPLFLVTTPRESNVHEHQLFSKFMKPGVARATSIPTMKPHLIHLVNSSVTFILLLYNNIAAAWGGVSGVALGGNFLQVQVYRAKLANLASTSTQLRPDLHSISAQQPKKPFHLISNNLSQLVPTSTQLSLKLSSNFNPNST